MRIKLHDDVEGHKSGETVDVPEERAKWYLAKGYASSASYNDDEHPETNVLAKLDPTLADNREDKPNKSLPEQVAEDKVGNPTEPDADTVTPLTKTSGHVPVELSNGKGDPEKAAAGKDKVEEKQASTDPADAPELNPDLVQTRSAAADTSEEGAQKASEAAAKAEAKEEGLEAATATTDSPSDPAQKAATKARGNKG
jgi:hypothetical protein